MHYYDGHFWGMHFVWWIIWIFFLIWIFIFSGNNPIIKAKKEEPVDILKKSFSKGEISKEEFEEAKKIIKSDY